MKKLPEIGKTYNCFDDGKISKSRMYQVTIDEIIPFEKANNELLQLWKEEGIPSYWLFEKTDYFIKFTSNEFKDKPNGVFARTKDGGWFGLGNFWNTGRLDIDGSLTQSLSTQLLTVCGFVQVGIKALKFQSTTKLNLKTKI